MALKAFCDGCDVELTGKEDQYQVYSQFRKGKSNFNEGYKREITRYYCVSCYNKLFHK